MILAQCGLPYTQGTTNFHRLAYYSRPDSCAQMDNLLHLTKRCLQPGIIKNSGEAQPLPPCQPDTGRPQEPSGAPTAAELFVVQKCPQCQKISLRKPPPASLVPKPIFNVPFTLVGMDLVGVLQKVCPGPWVYFGGDWLCDQVPSLKSNLQVYRNSILQLGWNSQEDLLQPKYALCHLWASVHHQLTDGLVECFSQTLKQMLWMVVIMGGRDWDLLIFNILFAVWASTGFSPFELLFRWSLWCPSLTAACIFAMTSISEFDS